MTNNKINNSLPFYLKKPGGSMKPLIYAAIAVGLFSLSNPFLLLLLPVIAFLLVKVYKEQITEKSIEIKNAIDYFLEKNYDECIKCINKVLYYDPNSERAIIMLGLIWYEKEDFSKALEFFEKIPKKIVKNDLDLQLKMADSYVKVKNNEKAKEMYKNLLKINPNSKYIKDILTTLN